MPLHVIFDDEMVEKIKPIAESHGRVTSDFIHDLVLQEIWKHDPSFRKSFEVKHEEDKNKIVAELLVFSFGVFILVASLLLFFIGLHLYGYKVMGGVGFLILIFTWVYRHKLVYISTNLMKGDCK